MVRALEHDSVCDPRANAALPDILDKEVMTLIPRVHGSTFWGHPGGKEASIAGKPARVGRQRRAHKRKPGSRGDVPPAATKDFHARPQRRRELHRLYTAAH